MATFEAQVEGLTSLSIDGNSAPTQTELTQFLTDGAKEILSVLPKQKKAMYSTSNTLDSGDTTLTIGGSEILGVVRNDGTIDQPCRRIPLSLSGRAQDSEEMIYGTVTDPVWWITINALNMFPTPTDAQNGLIQTLAYPAVAYGESSITKFPDEAEYLVPIYASIKAIQNALGAKAGDSDISTALSAITSTLNEVDNIVDVAKGKVTDFYTSIGDIDDTTQLWDDTNKRFAVVKNALDYAGNLIDGNKPDAAYDAAQNLLDVNAALDGIQAHLADGETVLGANPASGLIFDALGAITTNAGSSVTALGNMATEMALANAEVDGVTTTLAQALALTDSGSTDIATALDGMQTANAKFRADGGDPALFGDESTYDTADSAMTNVKIYVDRAISYINGDFPAATHDLLLNLADVDTQLTNEDIELAGARMKQAQTTMNAVQTDLQIAQTYITEWNTMVQTLVQEVNAFASEASARYGWVNAKAVAWQGKLSAAQGYMATAGGYANQANGFNSTAQTYATEAQTRIGLASGYIAEINGRLAQAQSKREESRSRVEFGNAYLQEASSSANEAQTYANEVSARVAQVQAQISVAQGYIANGAGYSRVADGYGKTAQGYLGTASNYLQAAQGYASSAQAYANEIQSKIGIAQAYGNEVQSRLAVDTTEYTWLEKQQAKLQADYDKGLQMVAGA